MRRTITEHQVSIWMDGDVPALMVYAGREWRVTDMPTLLRRSVWELPLDEEHRHMYGWRFQATDDQACSFVFDVYVGKDGWHVHRAYE